MFDDVVCFSHLRWGFVYQRPNHLMSRCARRHRVFFVEEPHFDEAEPRLEIQRHEHGLHVAVPHLPSGTSESRAEELCHTLLSSLRRSAKLKRPLAWLYTPMAVRTAQAIDPVGRVYDCMDELSHFHGAHGGLAHREDELFRMADVVFTGGHSLFEAKRLRHRNVFAFPSSVDRAHFERARGSEEDPADQAVIPHPRVGFFGVIDERLDLPLVDALAAIRPDIHFVLVGPVVKIDPQTLPRRTNIHWLGQKTYAELPGYIAGWNVAFMPFARNDATKFISPTKTLEYLAAGRSVVSTSIRDVVRPYGDQNLVRIADEPLAFAAAIDAALAESGTPEGAALLHACDSMLARTSWDRTWARMYALVEDVLVRRGCVIEEEGAPCSTF